MNESTQPEPTQEQITKASNAALRRAMRSTDARRGGRRLRRAKGSGSDGPQPIGAALDELISTQGWTTPAAIAQLSLDWAQIVGPEVADHVSVERFDDGVLYLLAESTAWATQVRLLAAQVLRQVAEHLGDGVVTRIEVRGPTAPSWVKGPRRVKGLGPRDTYG